MQPNMSALDRITRVLLALGMIAVYFVGLLPAWLGLILLVLALVFLATSIVGYCPLYWPFGFSTRKSNPA